MNGRKEGPVSYVPVYFVDDLLLYNQWASPIFISPQT